MSSGPLDRVARLDQIPAKTGNPLGLIAGYGLVNSLTKVSSVGLPGYSQAGVDDDGVGFNWEAEDAGVLARVPERHLLPLGVLLREQADLRNTVVLEKNNSVEL